MNTNRVVKYRFFILSAMVALAIASAAHAVVVTFPDANLEAVIREAINKPTGDITDADLLGLTQLIFNARGVTNLQGIEYCVDLELLGFAGPGNLVSDLSPIQHLTNITNLCAHSNNISDLSPLANLVNMEELDLGGNYVTDLSPLSGMTNLRRLWLWGGGEQNVVQSLAPLADLQAMEDLIVRSCVISDISPLANLTSLTSLNLGGDDWDSSGTDGLIADITPLQSLTALTNLGLGGNEISDISILSGLVNLESLGVGYNVDISSVAALSSLPNLTGLNVAGTAVSDLGFMRTRTNWTWLRIGNTRGANLVPLSQLDFLSVQQDLDSLDLSGFNLSGTWLNNISGLTSLTSLGLMGNEISDIRPLASLISLEYLWVHHNDISDIGPIANMTGLRWVYLRDNPLSSLEPLSSLTSLCSINADHCNISDISPLAGLINTEVLQLYDNQIDDVADLADLVNLRDLQLQNNRISDLGSLLNNTGLGFTDSLNVEGNPLALDSLCTYIPALEARGVTVYASESCPYSGCYYSDLFDEQWADLSLDYALDPDVDGDGLPERWALRLVAVILCDERYSYNDDVYEAYTQNLLELNNEGPAIEPYKECLAALLLMGVDVRDFFIAELSLTGTYDVFTDSGKSPNEPFSGTGDVDQDGYTNAEEYDAVVSSGGTIEDFAEVAVYWAGAGSLPGASVLGIGLMALACVVVCVRCLKLL